MQLFNLMSFWIWINSIAKLFWASSQKEASTLNLESLDNLNEIASYISSEEFVGDYLVNENELMLSFNGNDEAQSQ